MTASDLQRGGVALRYVADGSISGYSEAARRLVRALRTRSDKVQLQAWHGLPDDPEGALAAHPRDDAPTEIDNDSPTVAHLVPEYYPAVRRAVDGALIAHTVWETDRLPKQWPALLSLVDRVVVPSRWNRDILAASGVTVPIDVVPHAACVPQHGGSLAPIGVKPDEFVFYTIGRWDQRKALFHTVRAFLDAFDGNHRVVLVVKTGKHAAMPPPSDWPHNSALASTTGWHVAHLMSRYRNPARVVLATGDWHDDGIAALHSRGDCFVSLSRGEGWGLGAFDACVYGNPVVATGWGGFLEYLDARHAWLVDYQLVPVDHMTPNSYSADQKWAEPVSAHASDLLSSIAADPDSARERASPLSDTVRQKFAPSLVAAQFSEVIRNV